MEANASKNCSSYRRSIAVYLEGDLDPASEFGLEAHIAGCAGCRDELNEQKRFLSVLDSALESPNAIALPGNFTEVVVANAESKVKGLRCPTERWRAALVICGLLVFLIVGLGADAARTIGAASLVGDRFLAVFGFFARLVWDLTVAASVILRSVSSPFLANPAVALVFSGTVLILGFFGFTRLIERHRRA